MVKNAEAQMRENGLDFSKFYSMSLQIPLGSQVELKIDGKKLELTDRNSDVKNVRIGSNNPSFNDCKTTLENNSYASIDDLSPDLKADVLNLITKIHDKGYVKNAHLWRRWVTAQTFKMLGYNGGWDAYVRENFTWNYCFRQMKDEYYAQIKMLEDKDYNEFNLRQHFFNKNTAYEVLNSYYRQLYKKLRNRTILQNIPFTDALDKISYFRTLANEVVSATNPKKIYFIMSDAHRHYIRLPKGTPLSSAWKNAYRGSGAYFTLKNLIMWHDVNLHCTENNTPVVIKGTLNSLSKLNACLKDFGIDYWKFHILLKNTIKAEHFNLKQSITEHK